MKRLDPNENGRKFEPRRVSKPFSVIFWLTLIAEVSAVFTLIFTGAGTHAWPVVRDSAVRETNPATALLSLEARHFMPLE